MNYASEALDTVEHLSLIIIGGAAHAGSSRSRGEYACSNHFRISGAGYSVTGERTGTAEPSLSRRPRDRINSSSLCSTSKRYFDQADALAPLRRVNGTVRG